MNKTMVAAGVFSLSAGAAFAGGIDRSGQGINLIFEQGRAAQFSFASVNPTVPSTNPALAGNVGRNYTQLSFGYKYAVNDQFDFALIFDQPFGADIAYGTGPLVNTTASLSSNALTGVLRYKLNNGLSLLGGLRAQTLTGEATVPAAAAYTLDTDTSVGGGYLLGIAFEKPEIALRVSLIYNSKVKHTLTGTESSLFGPSVLDFNNTTPQSVTLDFQTGVAADTLVFGSVRWVDWSEYDVTPAAYPGGSLVDYQDDVITYSIGLGRKFNDRWSGAITFGYEEQTGEVQPNLGPTDGYRSVGLAAIYTTRTGTKITTGLRYIDIGDATAASGITFSDGDAIGVGISVLHTF